MHYVKADISIQIQKVYLSIYTTIEKQFPFSQLGEIFAPQKGGLKLKSEFAK